ncbi:hypothetical protein B9Z55_004478 [Caenorhabditis nigoni]|uniref:Uncharacterized protein n=1 Tax=Caenorhabditis nigoni TaxID=1611254 RepID=A0A2G5UWL9_9PELO|nr:hypothetical protein B9Z55_004478 [Caenorhabditis nigoni]
MEGSNPSDILPEKTVEPKGKLLNLWSRCIAKPGIFIGSSIVRMWSHVDFKQRLACATVRKIDLASKCLKRLPDVSLSCHVSASFSLNSAKNPEKNMGGSEEEFEKRERCRKIARIEYEIRSLERRLEKRSSRV